MSKKILCIILALLLVLSLSACSDKSLETIKNTSSDDSLIFLQYSHNAKPFAPSIEIPDNYAEMGNDVYAVLNDFNEVVGYKKIVLVTGGASGIGFGTVEYLLEQTEKTIIHSGTIISLFLLIRLLLSHQNLLLYYYFCFCFCARSTRKGFHALIRLRRRRCGVPRKWR